jgi:hypothetical protein
MPTSPLYNPSTVAGSAYQRAMSVHIDNPLNGNPSINFVEEKVVLLATGEIIHEQVGSLTAEFDVTNPTHGYIYYYLDLLYTTMREARDAEVIAV